MNLQAFRNLIQKSLFFEATPEGMKVTNTSLFSGKTRTMIMPITEKQIANWQNGMLIQNAFPNLSPSQREFIMTGATDDEWDTLKEDE